MVGVRLFVPLDVEVEIAVRDAEQGVRSRPGKSCEQQDRRQLQPLPFVLEDVDVGRLVIADQLHKLLGFEQRLLRVRVIQAILLR